MGGLKNLQKESATPQGVASAASEGLGESYRRGALQVGLWTLLSRVSGLAREAVHARVLGTGLAADAFRVAFLLPNLLRRLVGEGAITSAFVPVFIERSSLSSPEEARKFAERFLSLWLLVVLGATGVGIALSGWIVTVFFAHGSFSEPEKLELTILLTRWLFPYLAFIGLLAAAQGILLARGVFGPPAYAPLVFNLVFIGATFALLPWFRPEDAVYPVTIAVLAGGVLQWVSVLPALRAQGVSLRWRSPLGDAGVRQVLRLMIPGTIGAGVYQLNVVLSTAIATGLDEGAVSSLSYSNRLMEFVLGIFVFSLSTVGLTSLAEAHASGEHERFEASLAEVFRLIVFITIPSAVGLYVLREPIIEVLLRGGAFDRRSLEMTGAALQFHALGIPLVGLTRVLVASFHAQKDLRTPVVQGAINVVAGLALAYALSRTPLGHAGIALAASLAAGIQALALAALLRRRLPWLRVRGALGVTWRSGVAAALMGLATHATYRGASSLAGGAVVRAVALLAAIGTGVVVYFLVAFLLRSPEASGVAGVLRRRLARLLRLKT